MRVLKPILGKAVVPPKLSPVELDIVLDLQRCIDEDIKPLAEENDKVGRYPTKSMAALRSTQIFKMSVPKALGGYGISHSCSLEVQMRLAMADCSVGQLFKVHDELVREIFQYCPEEQQVRLASLILNENTVLGLAVAEPGKSAVDPMKTLATKQSDGSYRVNGFKIYTTAAAEADQIALWAFDPLAARDDDPTAGMQLFLVPRGTPGVTINRDWNALGQRATDSGSILIENLHCPPEWIASVPGKAPLVHSSLRYQAGFSALLTGMGFGALQAALPYVQQTSRPWVATGVEQATEDPFIRKNIGVLTANLTTAYVMTQRCGELLDAFEAGEIDRGELAIPISIAKVAANEAALACTSTIHGLMGSGSVNKKFNFDYWWRNARTLSLHDPVDWKMHEIGRHVLTGWDPEPGVYQ